MSEGQADEKTKINQKKKKKTQNTGAGFSDLPWKIYISRFLSAWGDRLWSFGAGIFMVELAPENLRLVAIYGLVTSVSVILLGAAIGNWIDKSQRLFAAQTFLAVQNLATALACVILALYFAEAGKESWPLWLPDAIPIVTIIIADIAQLASVGSKIILEKDWIVIISRNDDDRLAQINAVFRTIDLASLSLAPLIAGLIFDLISTYAAAYFIAGWNLVSVVFEYLLLRSIYNEFPEMAHKKIFTDIDQIEAKNDPSKTSCNPCSRLATSINAWILYMKYPVRNAGLGLAFIYMTVLGFDNITYGYCLQQCVRESVLGGLVGISAIIGVSGSISFPFLRKFIGLAWTGLFGFALLVLALSLCLVSVWLEGSPFVPNYFQNHTLGDVVSSEAEQYLGESCEISSYLSVSVLLAGIIAARYGLWVSDLSITQALQEEVPEEHRGVIGGVQNSLNSSMDTIKFVLVIILPQQETFGWLIIASFGFVCFGAMFYTSYAVRKNGKADGKTIVVMATEEPVTSYRATEDNVTNNTGGQESNNRPVDI